MVLIRHGKGREPDAEWKTPISRGWVDPLSWTCNGKGKVAGYFELKIICMGSATWKEALLGSWKIVMQGIWLSGDFWKAYV